MVKLCKTYSTLSNDLLNPIIGNIWFICPIPLFNKYFRWASSVSPACTRNSCRACAIKSTRSWDLYIIRTKSRYTPRTCLRNKNSSNEGTLRGNR